MEDPRAQVAERRDPVPEVLLLAGTSFVLDLLDRRDLDEPVLLVGPIVELADLVLDVLPRRRKLLRQLIELSTDERRQQEAQRHHHPDETQVGDRRADHPRHPAVVEAIDHRVGKEHDDAGQDDRREDHPYDPTDVAEDQHHDGDPHQPPCRSAERADPVFHRCEARWSPAP